jgi:hypothetical protein
MGQTNRTRIAALLLAGMGLVTLPALSGSQAAEKSGKAWVAKYPGSKKVAELEGGFRPRVEEFIKAARDAGAAVRITSTLRPRSGPT